MLNHHSNPSDNSETDHLQAAAIMVTARRKEQEAAGKAHCPCCRQVLRAGFQIDESKLLPEYRKTT